MPPYTFFSYCDPHWLRRVPASSIDTVLSFIMITQGLTFCVQPKIPPYSSLLSVTCALHFPKNENFRIYQHLSAFYLISNVRRLLEKCLKIKFLIVFYMHTFLALMKICERQRILIFSYF